jgi:signal transduction histidine kinase
MYESFVASGLEKKQMWRPLRIDSAYLPSRLLQQFLVAAAVTIFCSMTLLAYAVSQSLQSSLTITAAEEGALLVDYFIGPYVQELTTAKTLSPETVSKLDELLKTKLGDRTKVLKISLRDGTLVYSTNKELIGSKFPSRAIDEAFLGKTAGTFDDLEDEDEHFERQMRRPLMEIYAPLYQTDSRDIIAVGKIYNAGERLVADLRSIRLMSIAIVAAVTAPMMFVLFLMVRRAGATVDAHRNDLQKKVVEAQTLAVQNDKLRQLADDARAESIQSNERLLENIGQDLHDGPIQLLSIMSLKLSEPGRSNGSLAMREENPQCASSVANLLAATLIDLRNIATGLVLPQLDGLATEETLQLAISQHEKLTGTMVTCRIEDLPPCPSSLRVCLYRIVQEALNNSYHYANGCGQSVAASADRGWISVVVSDSGSGALEPQRMPRREMGLGLTGLRRRVEAYHGSFEVVSRAEGTRVSAKIPIKAALN